MIDRIKKIMSHFGLSPTALADRIGVPRSSISHLLSGRNKPSLDFVMKLADAYPEINLYWLLRGEGTFPSTLKNETSRNKKAETVEPALNIAPSIKKTKSKEVAKIVWFYGDGTFETFTPK